MISLGLFAVVWASLQWDMLRGLVTEGVSAVDTVADVGMLVMLLITVVTTVYAVHRTLSDSVDPI